MVYGEALLQYDGVLTRRRDRASHTQGKDDPVRKDAETEVKRLCTKEPLRLPEADMGKGESYSFGESTPAP